MNDLFEFDAFLSYSTHDKAIVSRLASDLRRRDVRVWFDDWEIPVGADILREIESGLQNSRVLVLCLSQHSVRSDWVQLEQNSALFRDPTNKHRRLVPVLIDHCEECIPGTIRRFRHIDYRNNSTTALDELCHACLGSDSRTKWYLKIEGSLDDFDRKRLDEIIDRVRELSGDASVSLVQIHKGSVIVEFESSEDGYRKIQLLFESGTLSLGLKESILSVDQYNPGKEITKPIPSTKDLNWMRNIGLTSHIDAGKTTLTERMLYYSGRIHKIRDAKGGDGGATMDLERERGITITSAATRVSWKNDDLKIPEHVVNIIDTPGHVDFTVEVERSLRVLDGAILVLCSVGGVQSHSLTVDRQMKRYGVPRIAFINKMDRTGANPDKVMAAMRDKLKTNPVPLQIPIGAEANFEGVVDLVLMQAVTHEGDEGETIVRGEIPDNLKEKAAEARKEMLEALSQFDDDLMETLLEEKKPSVEDVRRIIRQATLAQQMTPVLMGSAFKNRGVQLALDAVTWYLPCPTDVEVFANDNSKNAELDEEGNPPQVKLSNSDKDPMVAMAFKTVVESFGQLTYMRLYQGKMVKGQSYINARTGQSVRIGRIVRMHANDREDIDVGEAGDIVAVVGVDCASGDTFLESGLELSLENIYVAEPVIRLSIEPAKRDDADKLGKALERFRREDPTFHVLSDEETNETLIAGMGQLHLDVYIERIKREYKCECIIGEPRVSYKERPTKRVEFDHKRKKQSGGSGQYGHVVGVMEPLPEDAENSYEFVDEITGGRIPREYIKPCDQGFQDQMHKGPLGEYEVVGVKIILQDGSYHDVDSSDLAFKLTAREAMRESILKKAGMALLEPIMQLEIETPDEFQGAVVGHLSSKRGVVNSSEVTDGNCIILAEVPLAEMFDYANEIRSMTQGKGAFSMEFKCYRQAPEKVQSEVIDNRGRKERARRKMTKGIGEPFD